jgi:hypothetical protein
MEAIGFLIACGLVGSILAVAALLSRQPKPPSRNERIHQFQPRSVSDEAQDWLKQQG